MDCDVVLIWLYTALDTDIGRAGRTVVGNQFQREGGLLKGFRHRQIRSAEEVNERVVAKWQWVKRIELQHGPNIASMSDQLILANRRREIGRRGTARRITCVPDSEAILTIKSFPVRRHKTDEIGLAAKFFPIELGKLGNKILPLRRIHRRHAKYLGLCRRILEGTVRSKERDEAKRTRRRTFPFLPWTNLETRKKLRALRKLVDRYVAKLFCKPSRKLRERDRPLLRSARHADLSPETKPVVIDWPFTPQRPGHEEIEKHVLRRFRR